MYPGPRPPFRGMNQGPFRGAPTRGSNMAPMMRMGQMGQPARQGGGLLSKLLGRGNTAGMQGMQGMQGMRSAANASGGGFLKSLANPGSINGFLSNTQRVLKTAQQVGPMIQQYGPMIKNIPAMWKLYRGMKDMPDQEDENNEEKEQNQNKQVKTGNSKPMLKAGNKNSSGDNKKNKTDEDESEVSPKKEQSKKLQKKKSQPKLFI